MKNKALLLLLCVLLLTSMACGITDSLLGKDDEDLEGMVAELSMQLTEAAQENEENEQPQTQNHEPESASPTNTPEPTAPPEPTNTPEPVYTNPGLITPKDYKTDFTFNAGWYDFIITGHSRPEYSLEYDGEMAVVNIETEWGYIYMIQEDLYYEEGEIVYVEATIEVDDGPYYNNMGVMCRVTDEGWYEFTIQSDGNWKLWLYDAEDEEYKLIDSGGSYSINMKHDVNTIGILCDQDELTTYINGDEIKTTYNDEWEEGGVGLNVSTLDQGGSVFEITSFISVSDLSLVNLPD